MKLRQLISNIRNSWLITAQERHTTERNDNRYSRSLSKRMERRCQIKL